MFKKLILFSLTTIMLNSCGSDSSSNKDGKTKIPAPPCGEGESYYIYRCFDEFTFDLRNLGFYLHSGGETKKVFDNTHEEYSKEETEFLTNLDELFKREYSVFRDIGSGPEYYFHDNKISTRKGFFKGKLISIDGTVHNVPFPVKDLENSLNDTIPEHFPVVLIEGHSRLGFNVDWESNEKLVTGYKIHGYIKKPKDLDFERRLE